MAIGQIVTVPSGTGQLVVAKSHSEVQSLGVLNPNDGVVFLKLNGPALNQTPEYDWKLPSQSYGLFPGPWQSIGLYYVDQSGSNAAGDIDVYESNISQPDIPAIVAIGRSQQIAGTVVDITQGTQPQNPPLNTSRLWIDGTGHLHVLQSNGTDYPVLDSSNYGTFTIGGDLFGSIGNAHISVLAGSNINLASAVSIRWNNDVNHSISVDNSNNYMHFDEYGIWQWRASSRSLATAMSLDQNGNLQVNGVLNGASNIVAGGQLIANNNIYITGAQSLIWSGYSNAYLSAQNNVVQASGTLMAGADVVVDDSGQNTGGFSNVLRFGGLGSGEGLASRRNSGNNQFGLDFYLNSSIRAQLSTNSGPNLGWILSPGNGNSSVCFYDFNHRVQSGLQNNTQFWEYGASWQFWNAQNSTNCGTVDTGGFHNPSDRRRKTNIVPITPDEGLTVVLDKTVNPIYFEWNDSPNKSPLPGFYADEMLKVAPGLVVIDDEGEPVALNYANLTAYLWSAVRQLDSRIQQLESSPR